MYKVTMPTWIIVKIYHLGNTNRSNQNQNCIS